MSAHITHEEMTELLMGSRTSTIECHLQACAQCREEVDRVKGSLESFRVSSHAWSESANEAAETPQVIAFSRKPAYGWLRLAAVAAVLIIVFAAAYRINKNSSIESTAKITTSSATTATSSQDQIVEDNELLAQVDSEISEAVPMPMQPLQISAASSTSSSQNTK